MANTSTGACNMKHFSHHFVYISKGVTRLQQYLSTLVIATILITIINISIATGVVYIITTGGSINPSLVITAFAVAFIIGLTPILLYYDATMSLVKWSNSFNRYKLIAFLLIITLIIQEPFTMYLTYVTISKINDIVATTTSKGFFPEITEELTTLLLIIRLIGTLIYILSTIINLVLVAIFNTIKDEFTSFLNNILKPEEFYIYTVETWKLSDATSFLRIALILFLLTSLIINIPIPIIPNITGLIGFILYITGVVRAYGCLSEIKKFVELVADNIGKVP